MPIRDRVRVVETFASLLQARQEECARQLTRDTGKPITQARNEVRATVERVEYFAANAEAALADQVIGQHVIAHEPLGVVANISAWNYVYFVGTNVWAPGLAAGNAVIYKPSEYALGSAKLIKSLWDDAGCPAFALFDDGPALVDSDVDAIFFTGSLKTGQKIAQRAGLKKLQLELGGKDAVYVADDVEAAAAVADGAMYNMGQSCCSVERIYVHDAVYDDFVSKLVEEVEKFEIGDPMSEDTYIGPLCLPGQPAFLQRQVDAALAQGATRLTQDRQVPANYFPPTVVADVTQDMDIVQSESFGPVVTVTRVFDDAEAVRFVNDSAFGLTSAIYTKDKDRALNFLRQTKTGSAYWNCCDRTSPDLPWSGRKGSGIGVTMSHLGIQALAHPRAYHLVNPTS